jgi:large subunit ribosomal protein L30
MYRIVLKRSYIGIPEKQRRILRALGLRKIGNSVMKAEDRSTDGMVRKVAHLVSVDRVADK